MELAVRLLKESSELTEKYLAELFASLEIPKGLKEPMEYALFAGGKRLRPALVLGCCEAFGGKKETALPFAAAIEMLHTYSLVHDDLPCMDNDDLRRGKPSCHKQFGETAALLAGDALLNLAFESLAWQNVASPEVTLGCLKVLSKAGGPEGMIAGQMLDLEAEEHPADREGLEEINRKKTAALIRAACQMGAICGRGETTPVDFLDDYALCLGSVFQMVDDILDVEGDQASLGKPVGSDEKQGKNTLAALLGLEALKQEAARQNTLAKEALLPLGEQGKTLCELADFLLHRGS